MYTRLHEMLSMAGKGTFNIFDSTLISRLAGTSHELIYGEVAEETVYTFMTGEGGATNE